MHHIAFQLSGRYGGTGMRDHEAEARRHTVCGDLDDLAAIQHSKNAQKAQLIADVGLHDDIFALLQHCVGFRCQHQNATGLRHLGIIQSLATLQHLRVDVFLRQFNRCGFVAGLGTHHTVCVGVNFRNHDFADLTGQHGGRTKNTLGLVLVQCICDDRKRPVALQHHFFGGGADALDLAISRCICAGSRAVIVVHLGCGSLVDLDRVCAVPTKVLIGQHTFLALRRELFINVTRKLGYKFNRHLITPFGGLDRRLRGKGCLRWGADRCGAALCSDLPFSRQYARTHAACL